MIRHQLTIGLLLVIFSTSVEAQFRVRWTQQQADSARTARAERAYKKANDRIENYKANSRKDTVKILRLAGARLTQLPEFVFDYPNLTSLDLSNNRIEKLDKRLNKLDSLRWINLSGNNLAERRLRLKKNKSISLLYLHNNGLS
ncbi:MAG: leucine-rich repeat domain-containing protein [Bacteroidota bacterium]